MIIRNRIFLRPLPQFLRHLTYRFVPCLRLEPRSKARHARAELGGAFRPIYFPDTRMQIPLFPRTIANLQEAVQKAENHHNQRKTGLERVLCGRPAVGVDGRGGILGIDIARFRREVAIRRPASKGLPSRSCAVS